MEAPKISDKTIKNISITVMIIAVIGILYFIFSTSKKSTNKEDKIKAALEGSKPKSDADADEWRAFSKGMANSLGWTMETYYGELQKALNYNNTHFIKDTDMYPYLKANNGFFNYLDYFSSDMGEMARHELEAAGAIDIGSGIYRFTVPNAVPGYTPTDIGNGYIYNMPNEVITNSVTGLNPEILAQYGL